MQAAILNVKLKYLDEWTEARRKNADYYMSKLKNVCDTPVEEKNEKSVFHTFVVGVDRRKELIDHLEQNGIGSRIHYPIPIHLQKAAEHLGYKKGDFPICERKAEQILSLPVYQGLTGDDLEYIVEKIKEFYNS
jgi:dTDP-4-amino-4,6-dideoxygalactose transaminase